MSEELLVFAVAGFCVLLVFIMLIKSKKAKAALNGPGATLRNKAATKVPPPLPKQAPPSLPSVYPNQRALGYPKCPLDRNRNEPGKPQVIFWNSAKKCYVCCHGHQFTGRE